MGPMPVSHCFAVNGNESNPEVSGIEGILQAYAQCIRSVTLAGPTIFSQVRLEINAFFLLSW
jgi:prephenate dehydratase